MTLFFFLLLALVLSLTMVAFREPSGRNRGMDFNVLHGRWRVRYPDDGSLSRPMCRDVAEDYPKLFGGTVVPR